MDTQKDNRIRSALRAPVVPYAASFLLLGAYLLVLFLQGKITGAYGYYRIHYLYTYDHGYVARGLVGEVIGWFCDKVTDEVTQNVIFGFSVLLMLAAVLCIGRALNKVRDDAERYRWTLLLLVVICILPFSLRGYYTDIKLDKILWVLTLFAVLLSGSKVGIWFVPVLCALATMVNPVFLFCSMILISIILLQKFYDSHYAAGNGAICLIAYLSMIALGLFGSIMEKHLGFTTPEELLEFYFARDFNGLPFAEEFQRFGEEWIMDYFYPVGDCFRMAFDIYFKEWKNNLTVIPNTLLYAIPAYIVLTVFWKKVIRTEKNKFQKFIFFLCAISPVVLILPIVLSWESSKYFGNNIMVQLCLIVYYIVQKNESVLAALRAAKQWCREHLLVTTALLAYFALSM